jgi:hypothetical protein
MTIRTVTFRQLILLLISSSMCAFLVACAQNGNGGSSSSSGSITVTLSTAPPATMTTGAGTPLAAQITGDTTNSGVVWSCSPGNSAATCGQFSSNDSLQTNYTAPNVTGNVTITVSSVHQSSASANASVTITPPLLADGIYVFSLSGTDTVKTVNNTLSAYYLTGAFKVANGAITAGEQDSADVSSYGTSEQINPNGSSITQTSDGNLQIVLTIICPGQGCTTGVNGVETFNASFLPQNSKKANLIEFDASASASGTLELQNSTAASTSPVNGYAFAVNGLDGLNPLGEGQNPAAIGGVIDIPVVGQVSQANSVFDINDNGAVQVNQAFALASSVMAPDSFGRVEFELVPASSTLASFYLAGYIVDATHIQLIETRKDSFQGTLGGIAFSQGTNTGNFYSPSIAGDSYVFGLTGSHLTNGTAAPLQIAALLTFNSDTSISGFVSSSQVPQSPFSITAAAAPNYMVGTTGRVAVSGLTVGPNDFTPALYLDGNGHAMAITVDTLNVAAGHVLEGVGFQQSGGTLTAEFFNGKYGIDATGWDGETLGELDAIGDITATGSSGTFSGTVDLNWLNSSTPTRPGLAVTGDITATGNAAANGIFTGTITGLDVTAPTDSEQFNFYLIDPAGDAIAIETDTNTNQLTLLFLNQQ